MVKIRYLISMAESPCLRYESYVRFHELSGIPLHRKESIYLVDIVSISNISLIWFSSLQKFLHSLISIRILFPRRWILISKNWNIMQYTCLHITVCHGNRTCIIVTFVVGNATEPSSASLTYRYKTVPVFDFGYSPYATLHRG